MKLRFCMVTTFYPPYNFGGDGIAVRRLARALVRRGHHVSVLHDLDAFRAVEPRGASRADAASSGAPAPADPGSGEPEVHGLRSALGAVAPLLTHQAGRPVVHGRRIRRFLEDGRFDVIHYHNISLVGGPGILSFGDAFKLYTAHEHWLVCPTHTLWRHDRELCTGRECLRCVVRHGRPPQWWRATGYLERQAEHVDAFLASSRFSREMHGRFGFSRPMEVLPPFLPDGDGESEAAAAPPPHSRPYFLFAGRLVRPKGVHTLLPCFDGTEGPDLLVAGTGPEEDALRTAANPRRVRFLGWVEPERLDRYHRHARAVVAPSIGYETFGLTLIEAFRRGTPVIARRLGPYPEILERAEGGFLFDDPESLAAALDRLATDDGLRDRLGRNGRQAFREHWSEDRVMERYLEIVRRGVRERRGARGAGEASGEGSEGNRPRTGRGGPARAVGGGAA